MADREAPGGFDNVERIGVSYPPSVKVRTGLGYFTPGFGGHSPEFQNILQLKIIDKLQSREAHAGEGMIRSPQR